MITDLNPDEYKQRLCYYLFIINLDVIEVVIPSMTHPVEYVFQIKQKM